MFRFLAILALLLVTFTSEGSLPRQAALSRLDYTALVNNWGGTLDGYSYTHDPLGLRTNIVRDLGITESAVVVGHDDIGQITSWTAKEPNDALRLNEKLTWAYDKSGNLQTRVNNALTQTFVNDAANQASSVSRAGTLTVSGVTPLPASEVKVNGQTAQRYEDFTFASPGHAVSANNSFTLSAKDIYGAVTNTTLSVSLPASVSMTYDQNGNLTSDGVRSLSYDALNQLTTNWLAGAWKMEHVYDGLSRRRVTREYAWQGNAWVKTNETRYIYDGRVVIQERTAANGLQVSFTRGLDLSGSLQGAGGIGGLLARTDHASSSSYFYHADGAGNVTALSDGQGRIAARYLYNPFGRLIAKWGPMADVNRYQFSSKESDYLSGLSYYGYRFYDPTLQRWLTRDPLGETGGINLYGFVGNDPTGLLDSWGLQNARPSPPRVGFITSEILGEMRNSDPRNRPSERAPFLEDVRRNAELAAIEEQMRREGLDPRQQYLGPPKPPQSPMTPEQWRDYLSKIRIAEDCQKVLDPLLPESYWKGRQTPTQVDPGTRRITEEKPSSRGPEIYEKTTHYDEFGRSKGQTHRTDHNEPSVHPNPHHHTRNPVTGETSGPQPGVHPDY